MSSTPSSAARKAVTKLCAANKSKKVGFHIREITQGSKKKTYGPYEGYIEKLKEPIELKGRVIKYKPVVKLRGMRGGGYDSTLSVNKSIDYILSNPNSNKDQPIIFTITNNKTKESINYRNIKFLGEGTYGKVFLVENDEHENYVIKITDKYIDTFIKEPFFLNTFMNELYNHCQYKAISQGVTIIQGRNIGHIIFPYKGEITFSSIITEKIDLEYYPKILKDIILCLQEINILACHRDIKSNNIVFEKFTGTASIIDFGLGTLLPISIQSLYTLNMGNQQVSIELIFGYLFYITNNIKELDIYRDYLPIIGQTIDNFGLFWLIIESIFDENIFDNYFNQIFSRYFVQVNLTKSQLFCRYLFFYFNLDIKIETRHNANSLYFKLIKLFNYKELPKLREEFINYIKLNISPEKFDMYFDNDDSSLNRFITTILGLIKVDPRERITKQELLSDPFFNLFSPYDPPSGPPPKNFLN